MILSALLKQLRMESSMLWILERIDDVWHVEGDDFSSPEYFRTGFRGDK